jgi:hypothetical protein
MGRYMSGSQFGVKAGLRVAIFVALTFGFPFIVYGLVIATGAGRVEGASGALAVVAGIYLKPLIVLVFLLSLISPCWKRMRSLGLPAPLGLLVPFLFLLDAAYLTLVGTHWGVAFSLGVWKVNAPIFAMTSLAMLVAMTLASPPPDGRTPGEHLGNALRIGAILVVVLVVTASVIAGVTWWSVIRIWSMTPGSRPAPFPLLPSLLVYWAVVIKPFVCAAFCAAIVWMTFLSRKAGSGQAPGSGQADMGRPVLSPSGTSAGVVFGKR